MTATAGIWANASAQNTSSSSARPTADTANSTSSSDSASTISSNDFLTLLVTEMKNQDPTSAADPNQYVNQLVSVNSLEQLIQMNQSLAALLYIGIGGSTGDTPTGSSSPGSSNSQAGLGVHASGSASSEVVGIPAGMRPGPLPVTSGNLPVPDGNPAAQRVAQALSGHSRIG